MPGIGTFLLERKPAEIDFINKRMNPPSYTIALQPAVSSSKKFYNWLAATLGISEHDAILRFNDFAFDLKNQIVSGAIVNWMGVGTLSNGLAGAK